MSRSASTPASSSPIRSSGVASVTHSSSLRGDPWQASTRPSEATSSTTCAAKPASSPSAAASCCRSIQLSRSVGASTPAGSSSPASSSSIRSAFPRTYSDGASTARMSASVSSGNVPQVRSPPHTTRSGASAATSASTASRACTLPCTSASTATRACSFIWTCRHVQLHARRSQRRGELADEAPKLIVTAAVERVDRRRADDHAVGAGGAQRAHLLGRARRRSRTAAAASRRARGRARAGPRGDPVERVARARRADRAARRRRSRGSRRHAARCRSSRLVSDTRCTRSMPCSCARRLRARRPPRAGCRRRSARSHPRAAASRAEALRRRSARRSPRRSWARAARPAPRRSRASAMSSRQRRGVMPACERRVPARWIVGPSASGSENGIPTSITVAPAATAAAACSGSSSPAIR